MCNECGISLSFCFLSIFWFLGIFVASLINMIYSIKGIKYNKVFIEAKIEDNYKNKIKLAFLMDFEFGKELSLKNNYNSSLLIKKICYRGTCVSESGSIEIKNCSIACFNESQVCFKGEKKCLENQCTKTYRKDEKSECLEFNKLEKWRNTEMYKDSEIFKIIPYTQIKTKDETCDKGYRRCGRINVEQDFLCLKEDYSDFECPINKIVILSNNDTPSDNYNYKKYKIGDKNIFITNENTEGYLITDLFISFDDYSYDSKSNFQIIDEDSYLNFSKYNIYMDKMPYSKVALNVVQYRSNFTVKEMKAYQEIFDEMTEMYSHEKIEEMNSNVKNYKNLLMGLGIWEFCSFTGTGFFFFIFYSSICQCGKIYCNCIYGKGITPMKRAITFILVFFPCSILSLTSLIITFLKKIKYDKYLSMKYIKDYIYYEKIDAFQNEIICNNYQFISLLINIGITIIYPILIKLTSSKKESLIVEPLTSDNYDTPEIGSINHSYHGETPYYQ